jgi:hypothetical protein
VKYRWQLQEAYHAAAEDGECTCEIYTALHDSSYAPGDAVRIDPTCEQHWHLNEAAAALAAEAEQGYDPMTITAIERREREDPD